MLFFLAVTGVMLNHSPALDLADKDEDVGASLARDAKHMLEASPQELEEFTQRWFAPQSGEGGWAWWVAGADPKSRKALADW